MKTKLSRPTRVFLVITLLFLGLVCLQGCAHLQRLVGSGDQAKLEALLDEVQRAQLASLPNPTLPDPHRNGTIADWHEHAEKLTSFIEKYEAKPAIADPLRIRLAKLYLQNREFETAKATLASIQSPGRLSPRDHTFWALRDATLWWWAECGRGGVAPGPDYHIRGPRAIDDIANQLSQLENRPENYRIREHYAEMAVHIANYLVPTTHGNERNWQQIRPHVLGAYALFADTVEPEAIRAAASRNPVDRRSSKVQFVAEEIQRAFYDRHQRQARCKLEPRHAAFEQLIVR